MGTPIEFTVTLTQHDDVTDTWSWTIYALDGVFRERGEASGREGAALAADRAARRLARRHRRQPQSETYTLVI